MNFTENEPKNKNDIESNFFSFFKVQYVKHLAAQKLKEIKNVQME